MDDAITVALRVAGAFESIGADYFLGGSLASSFQGEPRSTQDIDFVVELRRNQIGAFVAALGPDFDVDAEALDEAVRRRSSWNIYFAASVLKIDLFIKRDGPFDDSEFARRRRVEVRPGQSLFLKSPEDTVLRKLLWFRSGGEVSTTQWRDIVQVLRVSGPTLDRSYLDGWAATLKVSDLLGRAQAEAAR
jgi:hypothetical protein